MKHLRRIEKSQTEQRMAMIKPVRSHLPNLTTGNPVQAGSKGRMKAALWIWSRNQSRSDEDHDP